MENLKESISRLSYTEKVDLMELLWDDISQDNSSFTSPDWHRKELLKREKDLQEGRVQISDWDEAKKRLRKGVYLCPRF